MILRTIVEEQELKKSFYHKNRATYYQNIFKFPYDTYFYLMGSLFFKSLYEICQIKCLSDALDQSGSSLYLNGILPENVNLDDIYNQMY